MTTYRTGRHWGVTIVREGDTRCPVTGNTCTHCTDDVCTRHETGRRSAELVAVVVNGDQALAERIAALLNGEADMLALLEQLGDPDPCQFDHNGHCQAHGLHTAPCPHAVVKQILSTEQARQLLNGPPEPPHPTCVETTGHPEIAAGTRSWVCGRDCPRPFTASTHPGGPIPPDEPALMDLDPDECLIRAADLRAGRNTCSRPAHAGLTCQTEVTAAEGRDPDMDAMIAMQDWDAHERNQPADSCTCPKMLNGGRAAADPDCPVHHGRKARGPKPPPVGPGCICDGSGRTCPRHGAVI